jgi:hypothetical protein
LQSCFEDKIPVTEETANELNEVLKELDEDGVLWRGRFMSWRSLSQARNHGVFLPPGSRLAHTKADAEVRCRSNGTIVFTRPPLRYLRGVELPLRLFRLMWASAEVSTKIFGIVAQEGFRIHVDDSTLLDPRFHTASAFGMPILSGCPYATQNCDAFSVRFRPPLGHIMLEGWPGAARAHIGADRDIRPIQIRIIGYPGIEGTFVHQDVMNGGQNQSVPGMPPPVHSLQ